MWLRSGRSHPTPPCGPSEEALSFETDTASGLQFNKYLNFSCPPLIIRAGFKQEQPPLIRLMFDLTIISIWSSRRDIYLITAALQNSGSWQLKENPSPGYSDTSKYHQSGILMHSRSYHRVKPFSWAKGSQIVPGLAKNWEIFFTFKLLLLLFLCMFLCSTLLLILLFEPFINHNIQLIWEIVAVATGLQIFSSLKNKHLDLFNSFKVLLLVEIYNSKLMLTLFFN